MKDIVSCFSENSVHVSNSSSSCSKYSTNPCISQSLIPSLKTAITCTYKVTLSTQKLLFIRLTWSTTQGLTINFGDDHDFKLNTTNSRFFGKKKGNRVTQSHHSKMEIFWDLSTAKYEAGSPEPVDDDDGFYVVVVIDSEIGLILGHLSVGKKLKMMRKVAKSSQLISRQEHCWCNTQYYSTKVQFMETGIVHDVSIRCSQGVKQHPMLSVCIDKKTVIRVKRLQWNFRGNQTIFYGWIVG